jgi:hypothetical protein
MGNLKSKISTDVIAPVPDTPVAEPESVPVADPVPATEPATSVDDSVPVAEPVPATEPVPAAEPAHVSSDVKLLDKPKKGKQRRNHVSIVKPVEFEVTSESCLMSPTSADVVITEIPKCRQDTAVDDESISYVQSDDAVKQTDAQSDDDVKIDA